MKFLMFGFNHAGCDTSHVFPRVVYNKRLGMGIGLRQVVSHDMNGPPVCFFTKISCLVALYHNVYCECLERKPFQAD